MKYFRTFAVLLLLCSLTSCATLFKGTQAEITLTGPTDEPVNIITTRDTFQQRLLPTTIKVRKLDLKKPITVESENYRFAHLVPGRTVDMTSALQLVFPFFFPGLVVDGITGAVNQPKQNSYAIDYVAKTDSVTSFAPEAAPNYNLKKKKPKKLLRHDLRLGLGIGNADSAAGDKLWDELQEQYHLDGESFANMYASISGSYYYHLNRNWALGALFGWNDYRGQLSNSEYSYNMHERWDYLSEFWLRRGDFGKALFYKDLEIPYNSGTLKHHVYYALPAVQYTWKREASEVYSGLALGVAYRHLCFNGIIDGEDISIDRSKWKLGAQITLFGVRWGNDQLGGFFELGVGHQGILIGGISYRF